MYVEVGNSWRSVRGSSKNESVNNIYNRLSDSRAKSDLANAKLSACTFRLNKDIAVRTNPSKIKQDDYAYKSAYNLQGMRQLNSLCASVGHATPYPDVPVISDSEVEGATPANGFYELGAGLSIKDQERLLDLYAAADALPSVVGEHASSDQQAPATPAEVAAAAARAVRAAEPEPAAAARAAAEAEQAKAAWESPAAQQAAADIRAAGGSEPASRHDIGSFFKQLPARLHDVGTALLTGSGTFARPWWYTCSIALALFCLPFSSPPHH